MKHAHIIAQELSIAPSQVQAVGDLFTGGATIPFIARYRKETHGSLDEVAITEIRDRLTQLHDLDARKKAILKSLTERELLTHPVAANRAPPSSRMCSRGFASLNWRAFTSDREARNTRKSIRSWSLSL